MKCPADTGKIEAEREDCVFVRDADGMMRCPWCKRTYPEALRGFGSNVSPKVSVPKHRR